MQRIDTPNRALALFGAGKDGFKDGNQAGGVNPTELDAAWFNAAQEEICSVIEGMGYALDPNNRGQLLVAIQRAIEVRVGDYALDTGTANAKVVALNPAIAAYTGDFNGVFKNAVLNTGPVTVNFGPGVVPLVAENGAALAGGDLPAGYLVGYQYVNADGKAYVTSMVNSQGDARYLQLAGGALTGAITQNFSGKVWEGTPVGGAKVRRFVDSIAATTGNIEIGDAYNCDLNPVTGVWAGRDVVDICWLEKWSDTGGLKEIWVAPTAAAGVVPAWTKVFGVDANTGRTIIGNAVNANEAVALGQAYGLGQTWQNVTASRAAGVTYTNTTAKPIEVYIQGTMSAGSAYPILTTEGLPFWGEMSFNLANQPAFIRLTIRPGQTYILSTSSGTMTISQWAELR
jgi:hypothetical protein